MTKAQKFNRWVERRMANPKVRQEIDRAKNAFARHIKLNYGPGKFAMPDKRRLIIMENLFLAGFFKGDECGFRRGRRTNGVEKKVKTYRYSHEDYEEGECPDHIMWRKYLRVIKKNQDNMWTVRVSRDNKVWQAPERMNAATIFEDYKVRP